MTLVFEDMERAVMEDRFPVACNLSDYIYMTTYEIPVSSPLLSEDDSIRVRAVAIVMHATMLKGLEEAP